MKESIKPDKCNIAYSGKTCFSHCWFVTPKDYFSFFRKQHICVVLLVVPNEGNKGNVLFNDILNTFYLWLYGISHMVNDHSDSERRNLLLPHGLFISD